MNLQDVEAGLRKFLRSPTRTSFLLLLLLVIGAAVVFGTSFVAKKAETLAEGSEEDSANAAARLRVLAAGPVEESSDLETARRDPLFFVGSSVVVTREPLPLINVALINRTAVDQVVSRITLRILEYTPYASIPRSRILEPIAVVDLSLPMDTGLFTYQLSTPILIAAREAATIQLRANVGYGGRYLSPIEVASYRVIIFLVTVDGLVTRTEELAF